MFIGPYLSAIQIFYANISWLMLKEHLLHMLWNLLKHHYALLGNKSMQ